MLFSLYSLVIFSLSFIRIFINVSPQLPDCSQCRCSSSVHWAGQQQSHYPCPAFFTLVVHWKTNLITTSTNCGQTDTWLVVLKAIVDIIRRPKLPLLLSEAFASDCSYFYAAYCLWWSVCYSSLPWYGCCAWHLRSEAGGFEWVLNLIAYQYYCCGLIFIFHKYVEHLEASGFYCCVLCYRKRKNFVGGKSLPLFFI